MEGRKGRASERERGRDRGRQRQRERGAKKERTRKTEQERENNSHEETEDARERTRRRIASERVYAFRMAYGLRRQLRLPLCGIGVVSVARVERAYAR